MPLPNSTIKNESYSSKQTRHQNKLNLHLELLLQHIADVFRTTAATAVRNFSLNHAGVQKKTLPWIVVA
jgi:hypothetical protein